MEYTSPDLTQTKDASTIKNDLINNHTPRKKKSRIQEISSTIQQLQKLNETINKESEQNEYQVFGQYVASQLQKLSTEHALIGQDKI